MSSRRDGLMLVVPLTPVVLLAGILTVSIYGAVFGVPVLVLTVGPWWSSVQIATGRRSAAALSERARAHIVVCVVVAVGVFCAVTLVGFDDIDFGAELLAWLVAVVALASAVLGAAGIVRAGHS